MPAAGFRRSSDRPNGRIPHATDSLHCPAGSGPAGQRLRRASTDATTAGITPTQERFTQSGKASYYARMHHGQRTANGETHDQNALVAAHRSLPFGTRVRVTNQQNGKQVVVRINDRGPFRRGRIIDVSRAAAAQLDMLDRGVVRVRIETLP